jgi:hypothetical protein
MAKRNRDLTPRSFHDEPFVIDNFPLGMDVGERHAAGMRPGPGTNEWLRSETILNTILVVSKKSGGEPRDFTCDRLNVDEPIKVSLRDSTLITLTINKSKKELSIAPPFELLQRGRRLVQRGARRIGRVNYIKEDNSPGEVDLTPEGGTDRSHVFVVLFNSNHDHVVAGATKAKSTKQKVSKPRSKK